MARGKDLSVFERGFVVGCMDGRSFSQITLLAHVSTGTVTSDICIYCRSMRTSVNTVYSCGWQHIFNDCKENRRLPQVTEKCESVGKHGFTITYRGYYCRAAVRKGPHYKDEYTSESSAI